MNKRAYSKKSFSKKVGKRAFGTGLWVDLMLKLKEFRPQSGRRRSLVTPACG